MNEAATSGNDFVDWLLLGAAIVTLLGTGLQAAESMATYRREIDRVSDEVFSALIVTVQSRAPEHNQWELWSMGPQGLVWMIVFLIVDFLITIYDRVASLFTRSGRGPVPNGEGHLGRDEHRQLKTSKGDSLPPIGS